MRRACPHLHFLHLSGTDKSLIGSLGSQLTRGSRLQFDVSFIMVGYGGFLAAMQSSMLYLIIQFTTPQYSLRINIAAEGLQFMVRTV